MSSIITIKELEIPYYIGDTKEDLDLFIDIYFRLYLFSIRYNNIVVL